MGAVSQVLVVHLEAGVGEDVPRVGEHRVHLGPAPLEHRMELHQGETSDPDVPCGALKSFGTGCFFDWSYWKAIKPIFSQKVLYNIL